MSEGALINLFNVGIALVNRWEILSKKEKNDMFISVDFLQTFI